jgi:hypothetical protein
MSTSVTSANARVATSGASIPGMNS